MQRYADRGYDQLRPIKLTHNVFDYADGSVLLELGKTRVLCAISLSPGVPFFLKGKKQGWLTASYSMLPMSTHVRLEREISSKRNDRSVEISRLIGRVFRSVVLLDNLGERTIYIDCDVLQADGGTRTACITAASVALRNAQERWLQEKIIQAPILKDEVFAVSIGIVQGRALLDIDFNEDSAGQADFNFIMTKSGDFIEIQGIAERHPIQWHVIESMKELAYKGMHQYAAYFSTVPHCSAQGCTPMLFKTLTV
jgi:ribonuclease PH